MLDRKLSKLSLIKDFSIHPILTVWKGLLKRDNKCPLCNCFDCRLTAKISNTDILWCESCGIIFSVRNNKFIPSGDHFGIYDLEKYISYYMEFRKNTFKKHLAIIENLSNKSTILDVGCSFGWFLNLAKDSGWKAYGVDPSAEISSIAKHTYDLDILFGDIKTSLKFNTSFQVITLWNVLEHISNPIDTINFLRERMTEGGLMVISVPNIRGLFARLAFISYRISFGRFKFALEQLYQVNNPYMHLFYFSKKTLASILQKCGFQVVKVIKQPIIDAAGIRDRIDMDGSLSVKGHLLKSIIVAVTRLIFFISGAMGMQDEIVLYARKN